METHFLGRRAPLPRKLFPSGVNIKQVSFIHAMSRERKKERKKEKKEFHFHHFYYITIIQDYITIIQD